jgi:hypothetical protein
MKEVFAATGGARIGSTNATFPFAKLTANHEALKISVFILGSYNLAPEQVVAITKYSILLFFASGIKIEHIVSNYPTRIIFWYLGNPDKLLRGIIDAGFHPRALPLAASVDRGMPLRWLAILAIILLWNAIFYLSFLTTPVSQFTPTLCLALLLGSLIAVRQVDWLQKLILKPKRSIVEILPLLNLGLLILGIMTLASLMISLNGDWKFQNGTAHFNLLPH